MAIVVAVGGTLACACGGNGESGRDRGAQPAPGVTAFLSGQLDDVPTLGRMNALGPERVVNRVATQSFAVVGETPKGSIHIYGDVLERSGWTLLRAPHRTGTHAWQGVWMRRGQELLVSSTNAPTVSSGDEQATQLSLSLYPEGVTASTLAPQR